MIGRTNLLTVCSFFLLCLPLVAQAQTPAASPSATSQNKAAHQNLPASEAHETTATTSESGRPAQPDARNQVTDLTPASTASSQVGEPKPSGTTTGVESAKPLAKPSKRAFSPAIEDNSFLIEEAYNQEAGIVQHITTCAYFRKPQRDVFCSFTQEWPLFSQKHQLSYTVPYSFLNSNSVNGVGDVMLNYRYQLFTSEHWAAVSPRISLIVPTGSTRKGLGTGVTGFQLNLPVSKRLSESFVAHFNSGLTVLAQVKDTDAGGNQIKRTLTSYNLGGSVIWLAKKRVNVMFEYLTNFSSELNQGQVVRFKEHIFSPGLRYAIEIGGLEIVPGIAMPNSWSRGDFRRGIFFYLSFEHPFKKMVEK